MSIDFTVDFIDEEFVNRPGSSAAGSGFGTQGAFAAGQGALTGV